MKCIVNLGGYLYQNGEIKVTTDLKGLIETLAKKMNVKVDSIDIAEFLFELGCSDTISRLDRILLTAKILDIIWCSNDAFVKMEVHDYEDHSDGLGLKVELYPSSHS